MTKTEASHALGVSERAIRRYAASGKLSVSYKKNPQGSYEAVYDADEVTTLCERFRHPPPPKVKLKTIKKRGRPPKNEALELRDKAGSEIGSALLRIAESATTTRGDVPIEAKLTLTLKDASKLAGLSKGYLLLAIKSRKLKASKRGRGWNLKRDDLEAWVKKL